MSMTERQDSRETHSSDSNDLSGDTSSEQDAFFCNERQGAGVAEAALHDGEKLSHHFWQRRLHSAKVLIKVMCF